jgi:antitoxin CcdA
MRIAEYLDATGTTLQAFGARVGVSHATVSRWASGVAVPRDRATFQKIAAATGGAVTAADFFPGASAARAGSGLGVARGQAGPDLEAEARTLGLDPGVIAAEALRKAVADAKARRWAEENRDAIEAHTRWVEANELPLAKYRMF